MTHIPSLSKVVSLICQYEHSTNVGIHSILPAIFDSTTALYAKTNVKPYTKKLYIKFNLSWPP